jgi:hypothetical protein
LEDALTTRGHIPWSFLDNGANVVGSDSVLEEFKRFGLSMANWEDDPLIEGIFNAEIGHLKDCDALILLEPAGHSSLAEAGIAYGMGKKVVLVGLVDHPEVVYRICGSRYPSAEAFLKDLDILAGTGGGAPPHRNPHYCHVSPVLCVVPLDLIEPPRRRRPGILRMVEGNTPATLS